MPRTKSYEKNSMVESNGNFKEIAKKAVYSGAIGAAAARLLFNETGSSEYFGMEMNSALAAGGGYALGSVGGDIISLWIVNWLDQDQEIKTAESTAIKLGIAGVSTAAALKFGSGVEFSANTILLGAGAKFTGDAVNNSFDVLGMLFGTLLNPHYEFIKRIHTDGFISSKKLDIETNTNLGDLRYEGHYEGDLVIKNSMQISGELINNKFI
jgi:hypothetical protein